MTDISETLDMLMGKAQERELFTRASKFSNVFKNITKDVSFQEEIMHSKLDKYIKEGADVSSAIKEVMFEDAAIVEDPDQISVEINYNHEPSGLPFFKSLYNRLLAPAETPVAA